jgi:hypothetical protein
LSLEAGSGENGFLHSGSPDTGETAKVCALKLLSRNERRHLSIIERVNSMDIGAAMRSQQGPYVYGDGNDTFRTDGSEGMNISLTRSVVGARNGRLG